MDVYALYALQDPPRRGIVLPNKIIPLRISPNIPFPFIPRKVRRATFLFFSPRAEFCPEFGDAEGIIVNVDLLFCPLEKRRRSPSILGLLNKGLSQIFGFLEFLGARSYSSLNH